jgi:NADPH:quinone reductase-like Zn-dependent oxidoreductase
LARLKLSSSTISRGLIATTSASDATYVQSFGAERVLSYKTTEFEVGLSGVDIVIDRHVEVPYVDGILVRFSISSK